LIEMNQTGAGGFCCQLQDASAFITTGFTSSASQVLLVLANV